VPSAPWETGEEADYTTVGAAVLSEVGSALSIFEVLPSALDEESSRTVQRLTEREGG
jgi:hypothetical protein